MPPPPPPPTKEMQANLYDAAAQEQGHGESQSNTWQDKHVRQVFLKLCPGTFVQ